MTARKCGKCDKEVPSDAKACPHCGNRFVHKDMRICPNCKGGGEVYNFQRNIDDPQTSRCTTCNGLGHVD
jgi:RNA polymerase subunit RPABC4/transcription elongation factor Spt4